jgi:hypothetical protein
MEKIMEETREKNNDVFGFYTLIVYGTTSVILYVRGDQQDMLVNAPSGF